MLQKRHKENKKKIKKLRRKQRRAFERVHSHQNNIAIFIYFGFRFNILFFVIFIRSYIYFWEDFDLSDEEEDKHSQWCLKYSCWNIIKQKGDLILNFLFKLKYLFVKFLFPPTPLDFLKNIHLIYNHLDIHHEVPSRSSAKAAAINKFFRQTKDTDFCCVCI